MKTFKEFINEASTNTTATVESPLYRNTLTFNISNVSNGPNTFHSRLKEDLDKYFREIEDGTQDC